MRYVCPAALAALSILTPAAMFGQLTIGNYQLVNSQVVSITTTNYTYTAQVSNTGAPVASVTATVTSLNPYAVRIQPNAGTLTFGPVATSGTATSTNSFTILVNRTASPAFTWADVQWTFQSTASAPVANAGPNQLATLHQLITLNGSGSTNPSGVGTLTYQWAFVSRPAGSSTVLQNQTGVNPTFTVDVVGTYIIQLTVSNGTTSSTADVTVTTGNTMPVANAGPNQTVAQGATVTLNGASSSDSNGNPMTFLWSLTSVPSGSAATLNAPTAVFPTFVADKAGSYTAQLIVNDGVLNSNPATVTISTSNSPPVANAGTDQVVNVSATVQLDGSGSTDIDGDPLTYAWSLITVPTNSRATLNNTTAVKPTFVADLPGTYIAQLIVHDGLVPSTTPSTVTITTNPPLAPTANAGPNQSVAQDTTVQLSGGGTDPQGYQLTYAWSFTSRPLNSTATLTGATTATPTFLADQPGVYTVQLVVNDGFLSSNPALAGSVVTITTSDLAPAANAGPPQSVSVGSTVTLNGSSSVDLNGDTLTYSWSFNSKPNGSAATLTGATTVSPTFVPDLAGVYVAQLIVTDSYGTVSNPGSTVTITATQTPASITASSGTPQTANTFTAFALPLVATVKDATNHPIQGVEVTFTAPGSGASGTFSNSSTTIQVATDVNGNATATFTANGTASGTAFIVTANLSPALGTAASFTLTNTQAPAASISATSGWPQSAQIEAAFGAPLVATVLDANSHPVPNVTVTFLAPISGASGTFAGSVNTAITNASGVATSAVFTANSTVGGPYPVNATVSGVGTPASFLLTNTVGAAASITATSGTPQSVTNGTAFAPFVVLVKDTGGNPVNGAVVTFTPPGSGPSGTFAGNVNTAVTNSSGVATSAIFTANTTAGAQYTVPATVSGVATPASFLLTNTVGAAASVTATSGTPQSVAIGTAFAPLVVTVKDINGNPLGAGTVVTFTAPGSGSSGTFAAGANTATTNASGVATSAIFTANNTGGPQYTVAATVSGVSNPADFLLTNTAGPAASITATSGTPQSVTEGTAFAALVATVKDSGGNPVNGATVTFTAPTTGPSGTFAGSVNTAATNSSGVATSAIFTANSTAGAQYTVAATVSGVATPANFLLTNTVGAAASITATSGTPQSVANGTAYAPFVVTVKDSGGNPVGSGTVVTFTAPTTGPSGTFAGGVNTATTNASGVATSAVFTANTTVGAQYTVSASATGVTTPASFLLTNTAGSPASIAVTGGSPQSVAEGTAFASLVATVKDSNGNVVGAGTTVTFTAPALTGASGTFSNSTITTTVATNASGVATATTFTANGILGGPYNVAATVSGVATPANFVLTNTAGPAASITATSGGGQTATISTAFSAPLVATVKDSGGNPISNATVTFTAPALTGASGTFANGTITTTATTSASGVATSTTFTANATGGSYSVSATVSGVSTPAAYALTNSVGLILQSGVQVSVGGTQTLNVSLSTAPTSSVFVTLTSGSPSIVTFNGNASVNVLIPANSMVPASMPKVTGAAFGSSVITATATGYSNVTTTVVATDTISFSPSTVTISGDTTSQAASYVLLSAAAPSAITLNLSSSNTAVATVPSTVIIQANSSNINVPVTGVSGGTATITASNTSLNIAATTLAVTVNAAQITTTTLNTGLLGAAYSQQLTASGGSGTYTWSITSGPLPTGMTLSTGGLLGGTPSATTPTGGTSITFKITDTSSPAQTATATLTLIVVVGTPATITATTGATQSTTDTTAFGSQLAVTVKDVNSYLVPNATVTFTAPSSGASGTFAGGGTTATATTNSSGVATSPVFTANSTLGSYTVNATVSPVATSAAFNLTNAIGPASTIAVTSGTPQSATEMTNFANPLVVTVKDVGANVISGATVTYTIVPNGSATGTFVGGVNTAVTNAQGLATSAQFTAGGTSGTYTVTAASGSATGATFALTNGVGGAATITVTSGNNQSAAAGSPTGAAFPNLVATVKDSGGNPVSGVIVTFAAPAQTLPSVTFATNPVTTDANGNATVTATANTHAGPSYTVTATATGVATPASFTLTNTSGPAASIAVSSGSPQNVADGTAFAALVAVVKDSGGNPVNNATVTFTIGTASGATASFSGTNTAATNASGLATSAGTLTANNVVGGPYTVSAAVSGVSTPASFSLTNVTGSATTVTANSGTPQSGPISSAFGTPLVAKVVDQGGNPVNGVVVTFQAPSSGASGTFANGTTTTTATTGSTGLATASTFTANGTDNNPSTTPYIVTATAAGVATPASFSLTNLVGTAASMTVNGGSGQGAAVGVQFTNPLSVIVKDSGGNPVSGVTVTFTSPASPNAGATFVSGSTTATATTGVNGIATTSVAPTANSVEGGYTVTATANPSLTATFSLTNNSGPPASITPAAGTNNQTTTVGTAFTQPLQVTVKDANNNPANGITVTFTAVANGAVSGTFGGGASTTALTNASGLASATLTANTKAGTFTVTAAVASPSLTTTFNLTSTAAGAAAIAATSGTGQNIGINTAFGNPLVATVTDSNGNGVSGVTVTFAAPAGSVPSATFTPAATATTGAAGTATVTATANGFASTTAYTVTATAAGVSTPASFLLTNNAGPASKITILSGNSQTAGITTAYSPLSVTVTDAGNNPISGATVTFTPATVSGATATFAGGVNTASTNASGVATTAAALTANNTTGAFTVAVSSGSATLATPFSLTNIAGPPATITLTAPTTLTAPISSAFGSMVATVKDAGGNLVPNTVQVTFTASTVSGATGTFSSGATATVNTVNGVATAPTFTANTVAGGPYLVTVAATTGTAPTQTFSLTNTPGAAASIAITSGNNQTATVGATYATAMVVTVKDASGNLVTPTTVTFTAPAATGTNATGTFGSATFTTVTTASGVATVAANALTAGTVAGAFNVAVTAGSAPAVNFGMTNQAGAATSIAASSGSNNQSAAIGAAFTNPLVVTLTDSHGNPVANQTVTFTAPVQTGASGTFAGGVNTASTNSSGVATSAAFTANNNIGPYTVTANISPALGTAASFSLTNAAGLPASITKTSTSDNQSAMVGNPGNAFTNPLIVTVKDAGGNLVNNATVTFTAPASTGASGTFANGTGVTTATTNSSGVATSSAYTTNTHAGADGVVVSVSTGNAPTQTFNLTNTPSVATTVTATSGGGQNVPISTQFPSPLVATVTDSFGNPVGAGTNVTFSVLSVPAGGQSASSATIPTNASGVASATLTANSKAGAYQVTATGQGLSSALFNITNTAGAASSIAIVSGGGQSATVSTAYASPLIVTVKDIGGNPVTTGSVTFSITSTPSGGSFSPNPATLNASGQAQTTLTANGSAGTVTVQATVTGTAITLGSNTFTETNTAGAPATITVNGGTPQSAHIGTEFASPLSALVKDANGNPVSNVTVIFTSQSAAGKVVFSDDPNGITSTAVTASNGVATSYPVSAGSNPGSAVTVLANTSPTAVATPATYLLTPSGTGSSSGQITMTATSGGNLTVGQNMVTEVQINLPSAPASAVNVTATADGVNVLLGQNAPGVQTEQIGFAAGVTSQTIYVQALSNKNVTGTITFDAPGYTSGTGSLNVMPSGFILSVDGSLPPEDITSISTSEGEPTSLSVYAVQLDANNNYVTVGTLRGGTFSASIPVSVVGGSPAVGSIPSPIIMSGGGCCTSVTFTASSSVTGAATIELGQATGFSLPAANVNFPVTVGAASIAPQNATVGLNLESNVQFLLDGVATCGNGSPGYVDFTVTSNSPSTLLLSNGPASAGTSSIQVPVVCGGSTSQAFYAQVVGGTVNQQLTYSVMGNGFPSGTGTITVGPSGFVLGINGGSPVSGNFFYTTVTGFTTNISVYSYLLDGTAQENPVAVQYVAPGASGASFNVGISSSNTGFGTVSPGTVAISGGNYTNTVTFTPVSGGTNTNPDVTNITVSTVPTGFVAANSAYASIAAEVENPSFSIQDGQVVGQYLQTNGTVGVGVAPTRDIQILLTINGPIALSATGTDAGTTTSLPLTISAGTTSVSYYIYGLAYNGTATYTVSYVSGGSGVQYSPRSSTITLLPSGVALAGINLGNGQQLFTSATDSVTYGQPPFTVEVGILNSDGSFNSPGALMGNATATATISTTAGNFGSPGLTSMQVTIPSSGSLSVPYIPPTSTGTATINLGSVSGVTTASTQNVITVHIEP